jgi:hypothetical protein
MRKRRNEPANLYDLPGLLEWCYQSTGVYDVPRLRQWCYEPTQLYSLWSVFKWGDQSA